MPWEVSARYDKNTQTLVLLRGTAWIKNVNLTTSNHQRIHRIITLVDVQNSPNLAQILPYCTAVDEAREAPMFTRMAVSPTLHGSPVPDSRLTAESLKLLASMII